MSIKPFTVAIPADVPRKFHNTYTDNYLAITKHTGNLLLFTCDHKLEHLNTDFYGPDVHPDAMHPGHLFEIAAHGTIGAFATHGGLIARYGARYPSVNYIVKLNGKTNLVSSTHDPRAALLYSVHDVVQLQQMSNLPIRGIGITVYLGGEYEHEMLAQAARTVYEAHQHGLVTIVWMYVRGGVVVDDRSTDIIAGAAGLAVSLGSDFVKVKPPLTSEGLRIASIAAGNTKIICAGGALQPLEELCQTLYAQMHVGGSAGGAIGRSIFQCSQEEAIRRTHVLAALIYEKVTVDEALKYY